MADEKKRKPGRPRKADRRTLQRIFNRAEWRQVKEDAETCALTAAAYVRTCCGLEE